MTASLTRASLSELLAPHSAPCLSLYQSTHRRPPDKQEDPIRFRNLLKEMHASLVKAYPAADAPALLAPFEALTHDREFWNHTLDGLAVLAAPGLFRVFHLPRPVAALAVVAESFHLSPLWQLLQSVDRYQVLGVSLDEIRLFEGDRDTLAEVELAVGVPRTIADALGSELTSPHQSVRSFGGASGQSSPIHHGQGAKADEVDIDANRFFRAIDRSVLEHHSRPTGLPLILAALPEHHHRFRSVSHNPFLLSAGIAVNPNAVSNEALRTLAWQVVEPQYEARLANLTGAFEQALANGRASDDLQQIATAAALGRVATLFIGAEGTGEVDDGAAIDPRVDDLGELVGKMGGEVVVIAAAKMPTRKGAAAIYRY